MKVKTQKIETKEYCFNEEEFKILEVCLQYCRHRLKCHGNAGIQHVTTLQKVEQIMQLR